MAANGLCMASSRNIKWLARLLKNYDLDLVKDSKNKLWDQVYLTQDIIKLADKI